MKRAKNPHAVALGRLGGLLNKQKKSPAHVAAIQRSRRATFARRKAEAERTMALVPPKENKP